MISNSEKQVTFASYGHVLTNANIWSPDGQWLVYDIRSGDGSVFDGGRIEIVNIHNGEVKTVYESKDGAYCGVATYHPLLDRVIFILGPEHPTDDWQYGPSHRQGVWVDVDRPHIAHNLDARDLTEPLTAGALRGGSHVHVWSADGECVSFTYNDALLESFETQTPDNDIDLRNIGVSIRGQVKVSNDHPRNHNGDHFSVLVTRTTATPQPASDQISRALEEGWVGTNGYLRPDGTRQQRALTFQGEVIGSDGQPFWEVYIVDLPEDITQVGDGPLQGTLTKRPAPPRGTIQRRLTRTGGEKYSGIQGPRHWLKSSPDGSQIAFLRRDEKGYAQIWTISPLGENMRQITHDNWGIASAFSWSGSGQFLSYVADNSIFIVDVTSGISRRLTSKSSDAVAPLALSCVFSPDDKSIAYLRPVQSKNEIWHNQIFIVNVSN
jgi:WD40 repeat protein